MRLFVAMAIFDGCPPGWLNGPDALRAALAAAIEAGGFTPFQIVVQPFEPQGVTACAVVGESHIALHSWPEEGRLFVDVASCSTLESTRRAIDAVARALPSGRLAVLDERVLDAEGARPAPRSVTRDA
jgi:S-adenosylmethionine decarboxylase